ncbi:hypothetical protein CAC42_391 [Sphaceloma murrayae]|uniref:Peptidase M24 domain-containing protein n=1 Tax=Sphaceloma murrayae TaxID=2082308 RepID=A0A2K1R3N3_9PEZI|nr:hypothetical protein CAC42_391 [Sphaceloma murrayae]
MSRELSGDTVVDKAEPQVQQHNKNLHGQREKRILCSIVTVRILLGTLLSILAFATLQRQWPHRSDRLEKAQQCTTKHLRKHLNILDHAEPISKSEFLHRRDRLAAALYQSGIDAFVVEPGYTFQYYANVSQSDWEPWEPEERPFVMVVRPLMTNEGLHARTMFLAPSFEVGRARMLGIPAESELHIVPWEEHEDPFTVFRNEMFGGHNATVMIDEEMRDYISRGIQDAGLRTVGLSSAVEEVRQIKSPAEIEILRAVNSMTVEGIRALQRCIETGMRERDLITILDYAMQAIGFQNFFNIVLFDENAALPHGGFATGDKRLAKNTMILIDVGYHYLGYSSDVCRSFFISRFKSHWSVSTWYGSLINEYWPPSWRETGYPTSSPHEKTKEKNLALSAARKDVEEKIRVWNIVFDAQTAAAKAFKPNNSCADVDIAARTVIDDAGYNGTFTHRLGHGIGIKAHESPYLNKANKKTFLKPGMTFTNEPGIYLEGKFGARHEDIYLVTEDGEAELLSGKRATSPFEP